MIPWLYEIELETLTFTSLGLHSWQLTVSPSWLSVKYFQAKALETFGMIVLVLVMLGKANFLFVWNNSREERSYLAKGWSTDNWLKKCQTFNFINYIYPTLSLSLSLIIFWIEWRNCFLGQLAYIQKPKQLWKIAKLISNCTNKEIPKNTEQFPKNTGMKI